MFGATECGRNEQVSAEDTPNVCVVIEKRADREKYNRFNTALGNPGVQKRDLNTHFLLVSLSV